MTITNRETWLEALTKELEPTFNAHGYTIPRCRFSLGFTSKGRTGKVIGECWTDTVSADQTHEIFIRCDTDDSEAIAATLVHEVIHAVVGIKAGHGKPFERLARLMHLEGKLTATTGGDAFKQMVAPMITKIGEIPHKRLNINRAEGSGPKKQEARLIKVGCPECDYVCRVTKTHLEGKGAPICPDCMFQMERQESSGKGRKPDLEESDD